MSQYFTNQATTISGYRASPTKSSLTEFRRRGLGLVSQRFGTNLKVENGLDPLALRKTSKMES